MEVCADHGVAVIGHAGALRERQLPLARAEHRDPVDAVKLGYLVGELGEFTEAEALLEEARRRSPAWALPCFNLAALFDRTGRGAEAKLLAASCPAAPAASGGSVARR